MTTSSFCDNISAHKLVRQQCNHSYAMLSLCTGFGKSHNFINGFQPFFPDVEGADRNPAIVWGSGMNPPPRCSSWPRGRGPPSSSSSSFSPTNLSRTHPRPRQGRLFQRRRDSLAEYTASLSHLRTMLSETSSCLRPAQRPNHAT